MGAMGSGLLSHYVESGAITVSLKKTPLVFCFLQMIITGQIQLRLVKPGVNLVKVPFLSGLEG